MLRTLVLIAVTANVFFITASEANKCTKPNEVYELCPAKCPFKTCGIDDTLIDCAPSPQVGDPDCPPPACRCKNGFFRDDKGNCVKWENCPVCKNANEEYDACPAPCPPQKCNIDERHILCQKPPQVGDLDCEPGCRCKDGYVRNDKGICIPRDQCPNKDCDHGCNGINEEYVECASCGPETCDSIGKVYNCPMICKPGCRCKSGHYRNALNQCITEKECLKCTDDHEFYSCDSACDNVCATLHQQNRTNCPIVNVKCNEMCYCEDGYARDCNNKCIPVDQCQGNQCNKNEVYEECPNPCKPQTCDEYGTEIACPAQSEEVSSSKPACVCKDGYLRNKKGDCIPQNECKSCGGDPHAVPGCGINCNRHCSDYDKENVSCIALCKDNACDCKKGYVMDENTGKCVKPKDCTPTCCENEVFSYCVNGGSDKRYCTQYNDPQVSSECNPEKCEVGCICADGYLRDENGTCIPQDQCPQASCNGDPNAIPGCSNYCGNSCSDYNTGPKMCPQYCRVDGCDCKKGYVYDGVSKKCVLPEDCPCTTTTTTPPPDSHCDD